MSDRLTAVLVMVLGVATWWLPARNLQVSPWPLPVAGFAFSPLRAGMDPATGPLPGEAALAADLALLSGRARSVRTYALDGALERVPALAAEHGIAVTAGIPVDGDAPRFAARIAALQRVIRESRNVPRVIVGNESLLEGRMTPTALSARLDAARSALPVPVSTAEPWHVWLAHPALAEHVDFLTVHILPYWEGVPVDRALAFVDERLAALRAAFPGKPVVIGEVGWPRRGRSRGGAHPGVVEQATFLSAFLERAAVAGYDYYLLEAFDQSWKLRREGSVGAYWGVFDQARAPVLDFGGRVRVLPDWPLRAAATVLLSLLLLWLLWRDAGRLHPAGRRFLALAAWAVAAALVALAGLHAGSYWSVGSGLWAAVVTLAVVGAAAVLLVEVHEWAEARYGVRRACPDSAPLTAPPLVSLHLPLCNEPPAMVRETLAAVAALDYPRLEVLVVVNNTTDPALWQPIREACLALGPRARFHHVPSLAGYKAGALNYALARTHPEAGVVAVVDADYAVSPGWLRALVGYFRDPSVVIVQAPQDYRDGDRSPFKALCHAEYKGFFHIGMVTRDARNAIIQHGTMTLVRRSALASAGGWGEWTITEDAELGLRLLAAGGVARYVPASHGRGLTPDNFLDYKRQRVRWAMGSVQILRGHRRLLLPTREATAGPRLGPAQRYHFVAGWLPWLADGAALLLAATAVLWSLLMLAFPERFAPPLAALSLVPVSLFTTRTLKQLHLYRARVAAGWRESAGAALAGMALMPCAGVAVLMGLLGLRRPFLRTPKLARRHTLPGALAAAGPETAMAAALLLAALATGSLPQQADVLAWRAMLAVMSVPFLCALGLSLVSALPGVRRRRPVEGGIRLSRPESQEG